MKKWLKDKTVDGGSFVRCLTCEGVDLLYLECPDSDVVAGLPVHGRLFVLVHGEEDGVVEVAGHHGARPVQLLGTQQKSRVETHRIRHRVDHRLYYLNQPTTAQLVASLLCN